MSKITCVIVEDSRLARNELKVLLKSFPEIVLVGEAENVDDGVQLIDGLKPDLLFLDINMPEKDGFELLEMLYEVPITIFTTAYDEYAIKSFEYNALDYLLKPISEKRFGLAIQKAKNRKVELTDRRVSTGNKLSEASQIFIKDGDKCWLVKVGNISLLEIIGNYTRVHFEGEKAMHYKSLNQIEEKLPEEFFFRANRQQVVNTEHISKVTAWSGDKLKLTMNNGKEVELSRRQSYLFKERMRL